MTARLNFIFLQGAVSFKRSRISYLDFILKGEYACSVSN